MNSENSIHLSTVVLVLVMLGAAVAVGGGTVVGQTSTEVAIEDPGAEIVESGSTDLIIRGIDSTQGVGAFEVNVTYNSNIESVQVSDSDRFSVESETYETNGETTVTIVGYTGETDPSGQESLTLAGIDVNSQNYDETGEIQVGEVSTLVDPEGDNIVPVNVGSGVSFTITESSGGDDDTTTDGGGGGGGGLVPVDEEDDQADSESGLKDVTEAIEQADPDIETERRIEDADPDTPGITVDTSDETETVERITFTDEETTGSVSVREYTDESVIEATSTSLSTQLGQDVRSVGSVADITVTDDEGEPASDTAATVTMRIDTGDVDNPENVVITHETDDGWEQLETTVEDVTDDRIRVSADVDGFSLFAVAEVSSDGASGGDEPAEGPNEDIDQESGDGIGTTGIVGIVVVIILIIAAAVGYRRMQLDSDLRSY